MTPITDDLRALIEQMREQEARTQARLDAYVERTGKRLKELKRLNEEG